MNTNIRGSHRPKRRPLRTELEILEERRLLSATGPLQFDFGTSTSPVVAGYTKITSTTKYTSTLGDGWLSGTIQERDRGAGTNITRYLNQTTDGTFAVNLASGTYQVALTSGDLSYLHDQEGIFIEGNQVDTIATAAGQFVTHTYQVKVTDGQLDLELKDLGGTDPNCVINALTISAVSTAAPATTYTLSTPTSATGLVGAASGAFSVGLASGQTVSSPVTITPSDGGAGGTFSPTTLTLSSTSATGTFTYTPAKAGSITITTTNNGGLTNPAAVSYLSTSSSLPTEQFNFGTSTSPTVSGYTKVTSTTNYTSALGYGWVSGFIEERDRGTGTSITRYLNQTTDGTFAVDVPKGTYQVTLTSGDAGYAHDQEGVFLEGTQVDSITTALGQFVSHTYQINVTDGQLDLEMKDLGGVDPSTVINALIIKEISVPPAVAAGSNITTNEGQPVTFSGSASGTGPLTYNWNFGDGTSASGSLTPTHTYIPDGTYTATLTVTDANGLTNQSSLTVTAKVVPPTVSVVSPSTGVTGTAIAFSASATDINPVDQAAGFTYLWNFGDGSTATGAAPSHTYSLDALYTVSVTATDKDGHVGSGSAQINVYQAGNVGSTTATNYTLAVPSTASGLVGVSSGVFTVGLPAGRTLTGSVTVTPNDGGAGGVFSPVSVVLSGTSSTASFTYKPAVTGSIKISTTNNGGLTNPASVTYTSSNPVAAYTLTGASSGTVGTASTFTITLGTGIISNSVTFTPSASNGDGTFSPTSIVLTNTTRSATFTYTPTLWGSRNISVTNNAGFTNPAALAFVSDVQLGTSGTAVSGNQAPNLGNFNFFANGAWWQAIGSPVTNAAVAPNSSSLLAGFTGNVRVDWSTTTANGGNSIYGIPYNVVSGTQALAPVELGAYASESDTSVAPFYSGMTIEGVQGAPPAWPPSGDAHALVMVRNESTGGIAYLYEGYMVGWDSSTSSWKAQQLSEFNLTTGAPRPEFESSSDAAGLPVAPLLVNYNEAALAAAGGPAIDHPFRVCISPGLSMNAFVWPARHGVSSGSTTTGLPMGSRLQISPAWYNANINSFSPIDKAIVTAMYNYGVIVADLADGGFWLEGVNDQRWNTGDLQALANIPVSAFQVLDTIHSPVSFTGPSTGQVGVAQNFNLQYLNTADSNFSTSLYVSLSSDGGATWSYINHFTLSDSSRGPFNFTWSPPAAGSYMLRIDYGGNDWIAPTPITFTATATAKAATAAAQTMTSTTSTSTPAVSTGFAVIPSFDVSLQNLNTTTVSGTTPSNSNATSVVGSVGKTNQPTNSSSVLKGRSFNKLFSARFSGRLSALTQSTGSTNTDPIVLVESPE